MSLEYLCEIQNLRLCITNVHSSSSLLNRYELLQVLYSRPDDICIYRLVTFKKFKRKVLVQVHTITMICIEWFVFNSLLSCNMHRKLYCFEWNVWLGKILGVLKGLCSIEWWHWSIKMSWFLYTLCTFILFVTFDKLLFLSVEEILSNIQQ